MPAKKKLGTVLFHRFLSNDTIQNFANEDKYALMPGFIKPIAELLRNEHYKRKAMPFYTEEGIYLDGVEIELAKRNRVSCKRTVDFLFGVGNKWILLTEAKFDVSNPREMKVSELKEKIAHSKELVSNSRMATQIEANTIVLLKDENFSQLYRELKNKVSNSLHIVPMNVGQFYQTIFAK
ncbi:MAG: hypothetical protein IJ064_06140 [Bacteroidaceae bacterium]|nr:hypothetical protein [Bacteroidaceae bacterium]